MKIIFSGRNIKNIPQIHFNAINHPLFFYEEKANNRFEIKGTLNFEDKNNTLCFIDLENVPDIRVLFHKVFINPILIFGEVKSLIKNPIKYTLNIISYHLTKKKNRHVFIFEGKTNSTLNHQSKLYRYFGKVFTWDRSVRDNNVVHFYWPQPVEINQKPEDDNFSKKRGVVAIYTYYKSNYGNYSYRNELIRELSFHKAIDISIYGNGWDKLNLNQKRYLGLCQNKDSIASTHRFGLAIENANHDYWVTEKVFDLLRNKCYPLYYGTSKICEILPEELFLNLKGLNIQDIIQFIESFNEKDYNNFLLNLDKYFKSQTWARINIIGFNEIVKKALIE